MLLKCNVIRIFKCDAARADVPGPVSPHDLRHTFASSLLAAGRPVPEVAYLLGHGSPAVTMQVYAHFIPGAGEGVADVLARWYATGAAVADRK
jgi:integrase